MSGAIRSPFASGRRSACSASIRHGQFWRGVPRPSGGHGESLCRLMSVAVTTSGSYANSAKSLRSAAGHILAPSWSDEIHLDTDALVHGDIGPQCAEILAPTPTRYPVLR